MAGANPSNAGFYACLSVFRIKLAFAAVFNDGVKKFFMQMSLSLALTLPKM